MEKYVVGSKILKKEQVLISIFLIAILVLSSGSMVAFAYGGHTIVVKPSGDTTGATDTAAIQGALNSCTKGDPGCTVQLLAGTYYISTQITVYGFQGSFVGAGQGQTNIIALPKMPSPNPAYDVPCEGYSPGVVTSISDNGCTSLSGPSGGVPWWAGYPGMGPDGSGSPKGSGTPNPWPAIFTFWGGSIAISGMTITDTSPTPTLGWYWPAVDGGAWNTALIAAIEITGLQAYATVDHVTVIGAAGDYYGYNMGNGIHIEGSMLPPGWTNPEADTIPLTGTFSVTNSVFTNVQTGPFANYLTNANVAFCDNTFTAPIASLAAPTDNFMTMDVSNTNVVMCGNHGTVIAGVGLYVLQGVYKSSLLPSTFYITDNNFQLSLGADGAGAYDYQATPTSSAVISGNTFQNTFSCVGAEYPCYYYPVIFSGYLKSASISQNTILGGATPCGAELWCGGIPGIYVSGGPGTISGNTITGGYVGVWVDYANGWHVTGNTIRNSATWGIAVTDGSSYNTITGNFVHNSGSFDLYWDQTGTGNVWFGNICQTSSPPGLC